MFFRIFHRFTWLLCKARPPFPVLFIPLGVLILYNISPLVTKSFHLSKTAGVMGEIRSILNTTGGYIVSINTEIKDITTQNDSTTSKVGSEGTNKTQDVANLQNGNHQNNGKVTSENITSTRTLNDESNNVNVFRNKPHGGRDQLSLKAQKRLEVFEFHMRNLSTFIGKLDLKVFSASYIKKKPCTVYRLEGQLPHIIIPTIWSKTDNFEYQKDHVTLVSQFSYGKISAFNGMLEHWEGPLSVALYMDITRTLNASQLLLHYPAILEREGLDLHIVVKNGMYYPVNLLRNTALENAQTDYVLLLDMDFMPSPRMHDDLLKIIPTRNMDKEVLVIPCMEYNTHAGRDFPKDKEELVFLWDIGIIKSSESMHWGNSHRATKYEKWKIATTPYPVTYEVGYEPYIIGKKTLIPRYHEGFLAGFRDKCSHLLLVYYRGLQFTVLPGQFAIHFPHTRDARPNFLQCALELFSQLNDTLRQEQMSVNATYPDVQPIYIAKKKKKKKKGI